MVPKILSKNVSAYCALFSKSAKLHPNTFYFQKVKKLIENFFQVEGITGRQRIVSNWVREFITIVRGDEVDWRTDEDN